MAEITRILDEQVPGDWFTGLDVRADRDEILLIGSLPTGVDPASFRAETKAQRIAIAQQIEAIDERSVSWGVVADDVEHRFTVAAVPTMTRLRFDERALLDTLIAAGVARSRSEALAWCVRTVGDRHSDWIGELRDAAASLEKLRSKGPGS